MSNMQTLTPWLSIVGIGEDGWSGLSGAAQQAVLSAEVVYGGERHLGLLPKIEAAQHMWKSPLSNSVEEILHQYRRRTRTAVLASGDPMLHGIGSVLTRGLETNEYRVFPSVSAFSLACARLGWACDETALVSLVHKPTEMLVRHLFSGQHVIVYSRDRATPGVVIRLLQERGFSSSQVTVFERLGGPEERRFDGVAATWAANELADLNVIAILCVADAGVQPLSLVPGLPEDAYETDGQLTKREVRAITLARLAPLPGQTLWDVGAGTGTVGIEWMRVHPACRAVAFEQHHERAARILTNAGRLGVPAIKVVEGKAPESFHDAIRPDAIFIGGGVSVPGLLEACWSHLPHGGRLVANTVTVASETALAAWQTAHGGELTRIAVSRAEPIGGMLGWRPLSPITQLAVVKP